MRTIADYKLELTPGRDDVLLTVTITPGITLSGGINVAEVIRLIRSNDDEDYTTETLQIILSEIYEDDKEALALIDTITYKR